MKVKNVSARLHHVGDVSIAPGEEKDIHGAFASAINKVDLVEVAPAAIAPVVAKKAAKDSAPE